MEDIITKPARKLLDALGNNGLIIEWHPVSDNQNRFIVVWPDETVALIEVLELPPIQPLENK